MSPAMLFALGMLSGILIGAGLIIVNQRCVHAAVMEERKRSETANKKLRGENARLWAENDKLAREMDMRDAYNRGRGER